MERQLHIVSTGQQSIETFTTIVKNIHEDIDAIHIRERNWTASEHIQAIQILLSHGVSAEKIIVNDRVDIAHIMGVKGVQLPHHGISLRYVKEHFPKLYIGSSVHSLREAKIQEADGADYVIYGHIFLTSSKAGQASRGIISLMDLVQHVHVPVIAIGGITPERTKVIVRTGAAGIAVMSGVFLSRDPMEQVKAYRAALRSCQSSY